MGQMHRKVRQFKVYKELGVPYPNWMKAGTSVKPKKEDYSFKDIKETLKMMEKDEKDWGWI